ncbi:MAG: hypothetical protein K0S61_290 [Anaerocolumna sp.]|jgi:hypothetical protein|nr:hypothetical protein [Anaerocolumna sp.]
MGLLDIFKGKKAGTKKMPIQERPLTAHVADTL